MVLAFAPWSWYPLVILVPALMLYLWHRLSPGAAFRCGWLFGFAYSLGGCYWIYYSLHDFGQAHAAFALAAAALLAALLAFYYAGLAWLVRVHANRVCWQSCMLLFPAAWVAAEWLRGWLFTGFPWNLSGQALVDTPLSGVLPVFGVLGAGWIAMFCAGSLVCIVFCEKRVKVPALILSAVVLIPALLAKDIAWTEAAGAPVRVSLVQANIPQSLKFDRDRFKHVASSYLSMTRPRLHDGELIIWPETALPVYAGLVEASIFAPLRARLRETGAELLTGIFHEDAGGSYNSVMRVSDNFFYHKRRLVPFGEFIPLRGLLEIFNDFVIIPMSDLSAGAAVPLLQVGEHAAGISICYEAAFGNDVADALPEADYLINLSNDSWFGDSPAPFQLLQIAQLRAAETGREMARVTSTGISAIIDDRGRVVRSVGLFQEGVLVGELTPRRGSTPYVRWRDRPLFGWLLASLALAWLPAVRRSAGILK